MKEKTFLQQQKVVDVEYMQKNITDIDSSETPVEENNRKSSCFKISASGTEYEEEQNERFDNFYEDGIELFIENKFIYANIDESFDLEDESERKKIIICLFRILRTTGIQCSGLMANNIKKSVENRIRKITITSLDVIRPKNFSIEINVGINGEYAAIRCGRPSFGGFFATESDIHEKLNLKKIRYGINDFAVSEIISKKKFDSFFTVAEWKSPVYSKDAFVEHKIDFSGMGKPKYEDEDVLIMNLRNIDNIRMVEKGDVLCVKVPPEDGMDGIDVYGNKVRIKPGKNLKISSFSGPGSVVDENGISVIADMDGHVVFDGRRYSVLPVYRIDGDVDYSTGNIEFSGSVVILGSVKSGFSVKANGTVVVKGCVESAFIETNEDVVVSEGIYGNNKAEIRCSNLKTGFARQTKIYASKNIYVQTGSMMHCDAEAGGSIYVSGSDSSIIGGSSRSGYEIRTMNLGNEMGTKTKIFIGPSVKKLEEAETMEKLYEASLEEIKENEQKLEELKKRSEESKAAALSKGLFRLKYKSEQFRKKYNEISEEISAMRESGSISIKKMCFSGVIINMRNLEFKPRKNYSFCTLYYEDGEIKETVFKKRK